MNSTNLNRLKLSIIIPMFNEEKYIETLVLKIKSDMQNTDINYELIVVDDKSTDNSVSLIEKFISPTFTIVRQDKNLGKGSAVRSGIKRSKGMFVLIQDADLEYDPKNIPDLYKAAFLNQNSCVYGSRPMGAKNFETGYRKIIGKWKNQELGPWAFNFILSNFVFILKKVWITDLMTGYKIYPKAIFEDWLPLTDGFETDHEITIKALSLNYKIIEVPIFYVPRNKSQGKKIRPTDGLIAFKIYLKSIF